MNKINQIIQKLKCKLNFHIYEKFKENTTIYRCSSCKKFKSGIAIDDDKSEILVFSDGSYISNFNIPKQK
jgi:hypothetical protein